MWKSIYHGIWWVLFIGRSKKLIHANRAVVVKYPSGFFYFWKHKALRTSYCCNLANMLYFSDTEIIRMVFTKPFL